MGEVWLAEQTEPVRRQVALKVIKAGMDSAQVVARFEAERQALALMDHPAIATVFDGGTTPQGRPYFAMEYVKGEPITAYCDRHRLSTRERLGLFTQVCEGVQHAHQKGVIHRDLKPSNVLVSIQDDRPAPKIIDFGVAKATAQHLTERSLFTELGVLIGTPEYMSPEQAEMGGLDIDTRTDIYALGVLLYELLTGALPFDRKDLRQAGIAEIQRIIREKEPPRPSTRITQLGPASTEAAKNRHTEPRRLVSELRGDLDWIAMRALEKDRTRRYQTANALSADVRRHLNSEPVSAGPPSATYRAGKFVRRHRFGVAVSVAAILTLIVVGVAISIQAAQVARERDRAARERDKAERVAAFLVDSFNVSSPEHAQGKVVTAREVLDRGAARIETELKDQPEVRAALLHTIGGVYMTLGYFDKAGALLEEALRERRRLSPDGSADVASTLAALGKLHSVQDDNRPAEALYREALALRRRLLGGRHPDVAASLNGLAIVLDSEGNQPEALALHREALAIRRALYGDDHPAVLQSRNNIAVVLFGMGDFAGAESMFREVLAAERRGGGQRPTLAMALDNLASAMQEQGKLPEAEPLVREALEMRRRIYGDQDHRVAYSLVNLGSILASTGRSEEAERMLRDAIGTLRGTFPRGHYVTSQALSLLGGCLLDQGRYAEAEPLLLESNTDLGTRRGAEERERRAVRERLLRLYEAWGKPEKAKEWRAKVETANSAARQSKN
jgi:tetratricopeptide (TPR) repeat protein